MALLKDLIVQGAARIIGDAYFATVKVGVWNGTPIDLSHGGTALTSGTQTAGKILKSTATNGVSEWVAQSTLSVGSATYASNVGASGIENTNYVTATTVIATCNWYNTMNAASDADALINRWVEVRDFLNNFTEADTLASILSTYVTLGTAQTITGAKTFANPISGDLLGNATTADRLKSTTAVGGAGTPVYFTGGLPVACTAANVRTFLGLGTAYSKNIDNSTAGYAAYYSAASTVSGTSLLQFNTTNSTITSSGTIISATAAFGTLLHIWGKNDAAHSVIGFYKGTSTKTLIGYIGLAGTTTTSATNGTPIWSADSTNWYQLAYSTGATAVGGTGTPVYVDANGQIQTCTGLITSGVVNLSGATTIDSLTAGDLLVTGNTSLSGNVSMGTVTAGTWNGSVIDVAHGGTGCSTLTSGSALIGNGTGAVTFRSIDNTTTVGSLVNLTTWAASTNLVTRNVIAHWDGRYQTTSNASNLAYCNKGAFGDAATRTYATAISTASGTTSATVNNYNSDSYVPTNKAVYNYVTSTLGVAATIEKTSITKSLNSSTWTETGYTLYGEEQGSYMLQITDTTTAAVFTGVFSVYHGSSATGNDLDEIPLHMCASATNKVRIYAATLNGKLLVSSQDASATNHALTIKYKKII